MIKHYFKTLKDGELKELSETRTGVWTHVIDPTDEEIVSLCSEYALDEAIVQDARDFFEVPRMERSGGVTYFFTRYLLEERHEDIETAPILIIMGESFVVTVALREVPQLKALINGDVSINTTQKTKFFIQIMNGITKSYESELLKLRKGIHKDRINLRKIDQRDIVRLVNYEHELNNMIAAIVPTNTWLHQITNGNFIQMYSDDVEFMEDLMIANSQLIESSRTVLKTIQNIRTATEAIMTNRLNITIKTLTILTIFLTIPTIVASVYGMNISLPLADHPFAFWMVLGLILIIGGFAALLFKRYEWL